MEKYTPCSLIRFELFQFISKESKENLWRNKIYKILYKKLRDLSPRANYTDRAAAAGRRS